MAWWISTFHNGRLVVLGCYATEEEANQTGFEKLRGEFEAHELMTIDKGKATAMIKAKVLEQTENLDLALKRARHKLPSSFNTEDRKTEELE